MQNRIEVDETGHSFERKYTQYTVGLQDCLLPKETDHATLSLKKARK